jgi:hypothetical protein
MAVMDAFIHSRALTAYNSSLFYMAQAGALSLYFLEYVNTKIIKMKNSLIMLFLFSSITAVSQEKMLADTNAVKSVNGIVKEALRLISGEKGKSRNWEALRNLFLPSADFTVVNHGDSLLQPAETVSIDEFIKLMHDPYYEQGYLEYETGKVVNEYNGIANVFQSFYGKDSENVEERGINSYQLVYFDNRWWIANLIWTGDSNGVKIPKKYLRN